MLSSSIIADGDITSLRIGWLGTVIGMTVLGSIGMICLSRCGAPTVGWLRTEQPVIMALLMFNDSCCKLLCMFLAKTYKLGSLGTTTYFSSGGVIAYKLIESKARAERRKFGGRTRLRLKSSPC